MSLSGFRPVAAVTLQVGGLTLSSGLYCNAAEGFSGSVESFLVQVYRCKSCLYSCTCPGHMTSHLSNIHMISSSEDFVHTGDKGCEEEENEEELFLYDMFESMTPPPCDISSQGAGLHVAHTCQVTSLFEDDCSLFKEESDQCAHLRKLGLCRISVARTTAKTSRTTAKTSRTTPTTSRNIKSQPTSSSKTIQIVSKLSSSHPRSAADAIPLENNREKVKKKRRKESPPKKTDGNSRKKTRRKNLENDLEKTKESQFWCSLCHRSFSSALTLRRHSGVHSDLRPFTCPHCPYSSRLKASQIQHLRTHTGERPFRCSVCTYASIDRSSLIRHKRTHSNDKPYTCPHCHYCSIQKKSLDLHLLRHHT